jgi:3-oxoacyl-[acyl-carrier-protein] synthase II
MKKALRIAQIQPAKVDYVNAHATSTPLGDIAENQAIKRLLLGEYGRQSSSDVNVSSTKGALGHLLGAAGAVEAIFAVKAIHEVGVVSALFNIWLIRRKNTLPPTINLQSTTEEFDCNYVPNEPQQRQVDVAMTNSFGFGGTNASLCFSRL